MTGRARPAPRAAVRAAAPPRRLSSWLTSGLAWALVVSAALTVWILFVLGGRAYYWTPLAVRPYAPAHRLLRPSGPAGQMFGVVGAIFMLVPFLYMARKRVTSLKGAGTLRGWLEIHLFCGVVGPLLVTFHTSFKFNGIVSAAYWSMVLVMLSGFVGRYLYVRIPRSIRGTELSRAELETHAEELKNELAGTVDSNATLARIEQFERAAVSARTTFVDLMFGELRLRGKLQRLDAELDRAQVPDDIRSDVIHLTAERATLMHRAAYLQKTKKLFDLWHVFHLPLVYLLLVIVVAHVAVAFYLGYVPFRW